MKNQEILRILLQDKIQRALLVDKQKLLIECKKIGLPEKTLYDFCSYKRSYVRNSTANKLYIITKSLLG